MKEIFDNVSYDVGRVITRSYSTSFSIGIRMLHKSIQPYIYTIYGFVRLADEIVDSFDEFDQRQLLLRFENDYRSALEERFSLNPVLNGFQHIVHQFDLSNLVDDFLLSMKWDLEKKTYSCDEEYNQYIYGSADVVGLMCLKVFVDGDRQQYDMLKPYAMSLGSAFQKVNFLRDIKDDFQKLGRVYFPGVDFLAFSNTEKDRIVSDIHHDLEIALMGIKKLPISCRFGVYISYKYYLSLLNKLSKKSSEQIITHRIRISNYRKLFLLNKAYIRYQMNVL
ncbi:phytoene/squalene synthase family protein [Membranihabitans marinus]|uniref:phytoene/squalene synthase family protein n=1 Tax=Membranihabitans marinus TaxID=1227546 RepID=UPI001F4895AD|nr:phytoene/squalene synthase family protein [Membranihabitans marinus]